MNETEKKAGDFVDHLFTKFHKKGEKVGSVFGFIKNHAGLIIQILLAIATIGVGIFIYGIINGASKKQK